jgi:hypothetical protein
LDHAKILDIQRIISSIIPKKDVMLISINAVNSHPINFNPLT